MGIKLIKGYKTEIIKVNVEIKCTKVEMNVTNLETK